MVEGIDMGNRTLRGFLMDGAAFMGTGYINGTCPVISVKQRVVKDMPFLPREPDSFFSRAYDFVYPENPISGQREFHLLPEVLEDTVGSAYYSISSMSQGGRVDDEALQMRLEKIVQRVSKYAQHAQYKFDYDIAIINSDTISAWSAPGGKLGINKGIVTLIDQLDYSSMKGLTPDDILAAVLAHETVHVGMGHVRKYFEREILFSMSNMAVKKAAKSMNKNEDDSDDEKSYWLAEPAFDIFARAGLYLYNCYRSRQDEFEADKYSIDLMYKAGYDIRGAVVLQGLFVTMDELIKEKLGDQEGFMSSWLAYHPPSDERLARNREAVDAIFQEHGHYKKTQV